MALFAFCWSLGSASALARPIDDPTGTEFIETTERDEDPLGIEAQMGGGLERAADGVAAAAKQRAERPLLTSRAGEVLTAIGAVREVAHEVRVGWAHGLEQVAVNARFASTSRFASELSYRLALPEGARLTGASVCEAERCQQARPAADAAPRFESALTRTAASVTPGVLAEPIVDARGPALAVRIAPVMPGAELSLHVTYELERPVRGGVVRLRVPPQGYDPRAAARTLKVQTPDLDLGLPEAVFTLDPWSDFELPLRFAPRAPSSNRDRRVLACDDGSRCERRWRAQALPQHGSAPLELWVLVDRSPSMEGPARGRAQHVVQALEAMLPAGSRMLVGVFDERAALLEPESGNEAVKRLSNAVLQSQGASTRLSSALRLLAMQDPRTTLPLSLVVVSDGRLTTGPDELKEARGFAHRGVDLTLVGVEGDRLPPARARLVQTAGGRFLPASKAADAALGNGSLGLLKETLSPLFWSRGSQGLAPGEQHLTWRPLGAHRRRTAQHNAPEAGWTSLDPGARAALWPESLPRAPAPPYVGAAPAAQVPDTGMPAESVLDLLRDQLVPKARACLRRDRKGRADHAVRAAFAFRLERREVIDARVQGELPPALRSCLVDVLAQLRVPAFTGRLRIRYPIYTERAEEPPEIALEPDAAARIERLFRRQAPPGRELLTPSPAPFRSPRDKP